MKLTKRNSASFSGFVCMVFKVRKVLGKFINKGQKESNEDACILCNWNLSAKRTLKLIELYLLRMVGITTQNTLMLKLDSHRFIS